MAQTYYVKDPTAILDYGWTWLDELNGDVISASTWTAPDGITIDGDYNTTTTTTVWLSGGTVGVSYLVTNHIVTAGGREDDRSFVIRVRER
jgi:hypothetical protein